MRNVFRFRRHTEPLMGLADALEALGHDGAMGHRRGEVALASIVGSAARAHDFDAGFRLTNAALRPRWDRVAQGMRAGRSPDPVDLVQVGELYFVRDGHHRVSVARSLGWDSLPATITWVCTVAYAMCCIRVAHLRSKAAERRFLERIPLPDDVRRELWLDDPAQWMRLADAAEAWAHRRGHAGRPDGHELARTWWEQEVAPLLTTLRRDGTGMDLRDVQLYVTALAVRDRLGAVEWPDDLAERIDAGRSCCDG